MALTSPDSSVVNCGGAGVEVGPGGDAVGVIVVDGGTEDAGSVVGGTVHSLVGGIAVVVKVAVVSLDGF